MVPLYSRVILPLRALLDGEFFNEYIKKGTAGRSIWDSFSFSQLKLSLGPISILIHVAGNILMLSEGRIGIDNVYSLREGKFSLVASPMPVLIA